MTVFPAPVMLFAAGFGTRMGVLTRDRPKPLVEVAGKPLIDHALDLIEAAGAPRTVANLHYKADMLEAHLSPRGVALSLEHPDILDTGGGLKAALPLLGSKTVATMNSDAIWAGPNPLTVLAEHWDPARMDALLLCVPLGRAVGRKGGGDFSADDDGHATRGGDLVFGGVQMIRTDVLSDVPDRVFSLNRVWDRLADTGRLSLCTYPGRWCDVGHPEGIALAESLLSGGDV